MKKEQETTTVNFSIVNNFHELTPMLKDLSETILSKQVFAPIRVLAFPFLFDTEKISQTDREILAGMSDLLDEESLECYGDDDTNQYVIKKEYSLMGFFDYLNNGLISSDLVYVPIIWNEGEKEDNKE